MRPQIFTGVACALAVALGVSTSSNTAGARAPSSSQDPRAQDRNGETADEIIAATQARSGLDPTGSIAVLYSSGNLTLPLTDAGTTSHSIDVDDEGVTVDVNVRVRIHTTNSGQLDVYLIAPDGTTVQLVTDIGIGAGFGSGETTCNGSFMTLDDEASTFVEAGITPYAATFRPEGKLASLKGKPSDGAWTLRITDDQAGLSGTLYCWQLSIRRSPTHFTSGRAPLGVFRGSTSSIFTRSLQTSTATVSTGLPDDIPVPGDYDGDGLQFTTALFRPSSGQWFNTGLTGAISWGIDGDVPVPGDYNGDGIDDIAVWRPSDGTWYVRDGIAVPWGVSGDIPVPGDYNGNGVTDVAVFRPSNGYWFINGIATVQWGSSGDIPVPADYDGDGKTDLAIFRPSNGIWYILTLNNETVKTVVWGATNDIPVPADYDGDGLADIAVWRPADGVFYLRNIASVPFGVSGDIPIYKRPTYPGYPY